MAGRAVTGRHGRDAAATGRIQLDRQQQGRATTGGRMGGRCRGQAAAEEPQQRSEAQQLEKRPRRGSTTGGVMTGRANGTAKQAGRRRDDDCCCC